MVEAFTLSTDPARFAALNRPQLARRVEVPSGFSIFQGDVMQAPREWLERTTNLVDYSEPPVGGHFAAFEQPAAYAAELEAFLDAFRQ